MKRWFVIGMLVLGATAGGEENRNGVIKVIVEGVVAGQGSVRIALEKNAQDFESGSFDAPKYMSRIVKADGTRVTGSFTDIPYGTYAIKTFQDLDGDGKLKSGFMGAPDEPWGFSNDATGFMGPAEFGDAKFELKESEIELIIHLKK